jgi:hypothetical protein
MHVRSEVGSFFIRPFPDLKLAIQPILKFGVRTPADGPAMSVEENTPDGWSISEQGPMPGSRLGLFFTNSCV